MAHSWSRKMGEKLKVAIIIPDTVISKWIYRVLARLIGLGYVEISCVIRTGETCLGQQKRASFWFRLHEHLDRLLYRGRYDYNTIIDCSGLIEGAQMLFLDQSGTRMQLLNDHRSEFSPDDNGPDILLNFCQHSVSPQLLHLARYGVFTFKVEGQSYPGSPETAYYNLVARKPEIECYVTLIAEEKDEILVCKSSVSVLSNSIHINRNRVLGLAELLIPRIVEGIYQQDKSLLAKLNGDKFNETVPALPEINPNNSSETLKNLIKTQFLSIRKRVLFIDNEHWFLLHKLNTSFDPLESRYDDFSRLEAPKGYYWADPFVVHEQGKYYLFVEEYCYETGRGHLAVLKPDKNNHYLSSEVILKKPYHLSYPFVFKYAGVYYLIPETKSEKVIQIYRCTNFPDSWEFLTNLMEDVSAADTTVFFYLNKWWLFTSMDMVNNADINFGELFLFYTDDLFSGRWVSHPQNPVITEINQSRPAGRVFSLNNKLIRPSQDCSGGYGKAVNLNQIVKLSETEYMERNIKRIAPDWDTGLAGMHTYNSVDGFYILDACRLRKRFGK